MTFHEACGQAVVWVCGWEDLDDWEALQEGVELAVRHALLLSHTGNLTHQYSSLLFVL